MDRLTYLLNHFDDDMSDLPESKLPQPKFNIMQMVLNKKAGKINKLIKEGDINECK